MAQTPPRIIYCHCSYAQVVPQATKEQVLKGLCHEEIAFDGVADLCELSARRSAALQRLAANGAVKIVACYPRAVKWLFAAANAPLQANQCEVINMRVETAEEVMNKLRSKEITPNLPPDSVSQSQNKE